MQVKKHFMQRETGVMKNYSCLTGPFKHIARKLTVQTKEILTKMTGLKLQDLCLEGMILSVNSNIIKTSRLALIK